ncbi:MAG: DNA helicase II [Gammaproteobacteria bacterium]|nr:DNA helicase II [Gammaproteobacteria bacterium]
MDVSYILDPLNDAQREAVAAPPGPVLVLAGAGSGKTRVLTHRVSWLVEAHGVSPLSVLAVTFTNKAAQEMRGRIEGMLGYSLRGMWMGTFHGVAHRLLRAHHRDAGLEEGFQILDSADQHRIVRRVLRDMGLDEGYWAPKQVQWYLNAHKEDGRRAQHLGEPSDTQQRQLLGIYKNYEDLCRRFSLVDFAELLLRAFELLQHNEPLREQYQRKLQHVLVDEFQDTNAIQYELIKLLGQKFRQVFIVGDDDQSIYGWRGARVENILQFEKDFAGAQVFRLEQNYRSTANILNAANAVIDINRGRLGKKLWTEGGDGESVKLYNAYNEFDEARFVVARIQSWVDRGNPRGDTAILYRSNAQSRVFEEILLDTGIPYRVYGGLRFFERAEIKDALAYLRLAARRRDDPSFERIVNVPARGIGNKTLEQVREHARINRLSLWDAARTLIESRELSSRAVSALSGFLELIDDIDTRIDKLPLAEQVDTAIRIGGLPDHYKKEKGEKAEARLENLEELVTAARQFGPRDEEEDLEPLTAFLTHAALEAGEGQAEAWEDCVQLMSLHSAKGLEFPMVFLTGMEEGLFPHQRSLQEPGRLEEERRLCYVGMTRAMQQLYLSHAEIRRWHGRENYPSPSRFLGEVPGEFLEEVRGSGFSLGVNRRRRAVPEAGAGGGLRLGDHVRHASFGSGTVLNLEGRGEHARVQVKFDDVGSKWLVLGYANLDRV